MAAKLKTKNDTPDTLLTIRDVAELDQVSVKTVRRAIEQGRLAVMRVGPKEHMIRIHPAAHSAYRRGSAE
jgi:excisionase family DNA binding protein